MDPAEDSGMVEHILSDFKTMPKINLWIWQLKFWIQWHNSRFILSLSSSSVCGMSRISANCNSQEYKQVDLLSLRSKIRMIWKMIKRMKVMMVMVAIVSRKSLISPLCPYLSGTISKTILNWISSKFNLISSLKKSRIKSNQKMKKDKLNSSLDSN